MEKVLEVKKKVFVLVSPWLIQMSLPPLLVQVSTQFTLSTLSAAVELRPVQKERGEEWAVTFWSCSGPPQHNGPPARQLNNGTYSTQEEKTNTPTGFYLHQKIINESKT